MSKRAIILAGGKGTRLKPYTIALPKPLVPVGDYPIIEIVLRQLSEQGFDRITLAVNHLSELIKAFCGNGEKWGIQIDYLLEKSPLGTMGALALIEDLPDNFLVMNGDLLTDLRFDRFLDTHAQSGVEFSISATQRRVVNAFGVLQSDGDGRLIGFEEKPISDFTVSMGIYGVSRQAVGRIPSGKPFGFDQLMLNMLDAGGRVRVSPFEGVCHDLGRPDDFDRAIEDFQAREAFFLPSSER